MGSVELIGAFKALFQAEVVAAQDKVNQMDALSAAVAMETKAAEVKGYDDGLAAAGQLGGADAIYSDAQMIQFIAEAKAEVRAEYDPIIAANATKIADLEASVATLTAQMSVAVADSYKAGVADSLAILEEAELQENVVEANAKDKLKAKLA